MTQNSGTNGEESERIRAPLDKQYALDVLLILRDEVGAPDDPDTTWGFLSYMTTPRGGLETHSREWRFQGSLGFGGKLYVNSGRVYVGYYPEDRTAERDAAVERANARIVALRAAGEQG